MIDNPQAKVLMQRARNGDNEAFALLYENFYTPIFRYIYSKTSQREQAEDLAQTVFVRAFQAREKFSETAATPIAYFFTIARNLIIDHYRKKKEITLDQGVDEWDIFANIPDKELSPHEQIIDGQQSVFVRDLLTKIKPEYREVVELKFLKQQSNREISKITGKTEQNIRQIQVRALKKLKQLLI